MKLIKKIVKLSMLTLFALISLPSLAYATGGVEVIQLQGDFNTQALTCPPPDDAEQCVIDQLTGDLVGTNKLVTVDFTETNTKIRYHDATTITSQYGSFQGDEHGVITKATGDFHSHAQLTSMDACGSILKMHYRGTIDLETLEDDGNYRGLLLKKDC